MIQGMGTVTAIIVVVSVYSALGYFLVFQMVVGLRRARQFEESSAEFWAKNLAWLEDVLNYDGYDEEEDKKSSSYDFE